MQFTHLTDTGEISMVNIGNKSANFRKAVAKAVMQFPQNIYQKIRGQNSQTHKGNILDTARIAGIMAAKQTSNLIPLCHPLPIEDCQINYEYVDDRHQLMIYAQVSLHHKTGVEMEALTAASLAALTVYDMCKALSHDIHFSVSLEHKEGGKSNV